MLTQEGAVSQSPIPINSPQELEWDSLECLDYGGIKETNFPSITIGDHIILFDVTKNRDPPCLKLSILEPEKELFYELGYFDGLFFDKCIACYWKENKIIVLGRNTNSNSPQRHDVSLGIVNIVPTNEGFKGEYQWISSISPVNLDICTIHVLKNTLVLINGGEPEFYEFERTAHYFDLGSERNFLMLINDSAAHHMSYLNENSILVYVSRKSMSFKEYRYATLDQTGRMTSFETKKHYLFEKNSQFQLRNGRMYGFSNSSLQTDYETLHVSNTKKDSWEKYSIKGMVDLDSSQRKRMVLLKDHIYLFDNSPNIWTLDLSVLDADNNSRLGKKGPLEHNPSSFLKLFLKEAPYYDITFEVESELIHAHKWCLMKQSKYFANMFSSGMIEEKSSKIIIPDMKASTFKAFLGFLYTSQVELNEALALELLQQADKFSVLSLRNLCEKYLKTKISFHNCVAIANLADLLDIDSLREVAMKFMLKNLKVIKERSDFSQVSSAILSDIINKLTA